PHDGSLSGSVVGVANVSISQDDLATSLASCGLEQLQPGNFTDASIQNAIHGVFGSSPASPLVQGSCTAEQLASYQAAGVTISLNDNCDQPYLAYLYGYHVPADAL